MILQIQENPYLQLSIGLSGYQDKKTFNASAMVYFHKRLNETTLIEINEKMIQFNQRSEKKE